MLEKIYYIYHTFDLNAKSITRRHKFETFRTIRYNFRFANETLNNLSPRMKNSKTRLHLQIAIYELSQLPEKKFQRS